MSADPTHRHLQTVTGLAALAAATLGALAVWAQTPAPPAGLRLHGLVEAVEFFNILTPQQFRSKFSFMSI